MKVASPIGSLRFMPTGSSPGAGAARQYGGEGRSFRSHYTATGAGVLALYDDNRNARITCKEARRNGIAPVPCSHPAYRYMRDADGDGVVCE